MLNQIQTTSKLNTIKAFILYYIFGKSTIKTRGPRVCFVSGNNLNLHYCTMQFSISAHTYHTLLHMGRKTDLRGRTKFLGKNSKHIFTFSLLEIYNWNTKVLPRGGLPNWNMFNYMKRKPLLWKPYPQKSRQVNWRLIHNNWIPQICSLVETLLGRDTIVHSLTVH